MTWATHLWMRPEPPLWSSAPIPGGTLPVGFTEEGHVVTADGVQADRPFWKLTTWNHETGQIISRVDRSTEVAPGNLLVWSPGEDCLITCPPEETSIFGHHVHVIDRKTGQPRYAPIPHDGDSNHYECLSSDGRYLCICLYGELSPDRAYPPGRIIDLQTGATVSRFPMPLHSKLRDGRELGFGILTVNQQTNELMTFDVDEQRNGWIVFRTLPDAQEVARCPLPLIPGPGDISMGVHPDGRFYLWRTWAEAPWTRWQKTCFQVIDHRLVEPIEISDRNEGYRHDLEAARFRYSAGEMVVRVQFFNWKNGPPLVKDWNEFVGSRIPFLHMNFESKPYGFAQCIQPSWSAPMELKGFFELSLRIQFSPDGDTLADGGDQLRVWRLPPPSRWWRLPGVLMIIGLAWRLSAYLRGKISSVSVGPRE
jgi:hypothetical protein